MPHCPFVESYIFYGPWIDHPSPYPFNKFI
jgi:hypothetical protein